MRPLPVALVNASAKICSQVRQSPRYGRRKSLRDLCRRIPNRFAWYGTDRGNQSTPARGDRVSVCRNSRWRYSIGDQHAGVVAVATKRIHRRVQLSDMHITFPSVLALDELRAGNRVRQIAERTPQAEGTIIPFTRDRIRGLLFRSDANGEETLIIAKRVPLPAGILRVVEGNVPAATEVADLRNGVWLRHPLQSG